jgi:hypothetical protein
MIHTGLRVVFLTLIGLVVSWAAFFLLPSFADRVLASDEAAFADAFRSAAQKIALQTVKGGISPLRVFCSLFGGSDAALQAETLVERRLRVSNGFFPFLVMTFCVSFLLGLLLRERLWLGTTYASPSLSFLSKRLVECALVILFVWSLAPLPFPYWVFFPLLASAAVGTLGWVGNLPLRL